MRTRRLLAFGGPVGLLLTAVAACEDSSGGGGGGTFDPESGTYEASASDTAAPDVAVDTAVPDAKGSGVTVVVGDTASPAANVRVVFQDAAGAVVGEGKTDPSGKATSTALPAMVTVLYQPAGSAVYPVTFMGVTDGDVLHVTPRPLFDFSTPIGRFRATFTPDAVSAKAQDFYVEVHNDFTCGNSAVGITSFVDIPVYAGCTRATNTLLSKAASASSVVAYAFQKNVPAPAGGSTVNVGPLVYSNAGVRTVTAMNLPTADVPKGAFVAAVSGPDQFFLEGTNDSSITSPGGAQFAAPLGFADAFQSGVYVRASGNGVSLTEIIQREPATAAATANLGAIDFAGALPALPNVTLSTAGSTVRPSITLAPASAPSAAAAAIVVVRWSGEGSSGAWTFVMPASTTTFEAPALPTDAGAFLPHDAVGVDLAGYVGGSLAPTFDAVKALPVAPDGNGNPTLLDDSRPLPANGTLKLSTWAPSKG